MCGIKQKNCESHREKNIFHFYISFKEMFSQTVDVFCLFSLYHKATFKVTLPNNRNTCQNNTQNTNCSLKMSIRLNEHLVLVTIIRMQ